MDSWSSQTASPDIKFENSPAESFLSAPGDMYPSLFGTPASTTMNPLEIMTPQSFPEDKTSDVAGLTMSAASTPAPEDAPTGDKKQSKKRKSWGQVLPEPKTNLPPRYVEFHSSQRVFVSHANLLAGSEPRRTTRRSSAESSASSATVALPSLPESESALRSRRWRSETRS